MKRIVRRLKTLAKAAIGKELLIKPDVVCAKERFGNDYGGWDIVTRNVNHKSVVYSFGIGEDASFDMALIEKYGLTVNAFDPTPKSIDWVRAQGFSDHFQMHEYGIAAFDGNVSFNPPDNPDHVSHTLLSRPSTTSMAITVPVKRLSTILNELGHDEIEILKMDIEGAEYDVIDDIRHSGLRPKQILVEFHHRFPGVGVEKTREAISTLRTIGYGLFSVSDTNEEYCFIRRAD